MFLQRELFLVLILLTGCTKALHQEKEKSFVAAAAVAATALKTAGCYLEVTKTKIKGGAEKTSIKVGTNNGKAVREKANSTAQATTEATKKGNKKVKAI